VSPFSVAPWHSEEVQGDLVPILAALRGDFFCMPFGANETPYQGEQHPPHGETANRTWTLVRSDESAGSASLHVRMDLSVRSGTVDKYVELRQDETVVYQHHVLAGMDGPMSFGHHAMLLFPDRPESGIISTSPFEIGRTSPTPIELPENKGYSLLATDRQFSSLESVPTITGWSTDLSRYPARKGYEDLVMITSSPRRDFAWVAVTFPDEGYVWYALKDPSILTQTVFWLSNGGRYYAPWDGRHENVLGIAAVPSYFHYVLAESVEETPISAAGFPTFRNLRADQPLDVRYIFGVVECETGFGRVDSIETSGENDVTIRDEDGNELDTSVNWQFLHAE